MATNVREKGNLRQTAYNIFYMIDLLAEGSRGVIYIYIPCSIFYDNYTPVKDNPLVVEVTVYGPIYRGMVRIQGTLLYKCEPRSVTINRFETATHVSQTAI